MGFTIFQNECRAVRGTLDVCADSVALFRDCSKTSRDGIQQAVGWMRLGARHCAMASRRPRTLTVPVNFGLPCKHCGMITKGSTSNLPGGMPHNKILCRPTGIFKHQSPEQDGRIHASSSKRHWGGDLNTPKGDLRMFGREWKLGRGRCVLNVPGKLE